jgi:hypothetical protein
MASLLDQFANLEPDMIQTGQQDAAPPFKAGKRMSLSAVKFEERSCPLGVYLYKCYAETTRNVQCKVEMSSSRESGIISGIEL